MSVSVPVSISISTIRDLLIGAVEGGSNYWASFRKDPNFAKFIAESGESPLSTLEGEEYAPQYDIDHSQYCLRICDEEDNTTYNVTLESLIQGLNVMANRYPRHFKDVITENHDAETSDVFIQCSVFGEIVYG